MPRTPTDYSKTIIYKIQNIDNPELLYVGSTTDFTKRKNCHKNNCDNPNTKCHNFKLYQMIRENGGWDMFNMVIVKEFPCENKRQAEAEEDRCIREMKANLNSHRAFVTPEERIEQMKQYRLEHKEQIAEQVKQYYTKHKDKIKQWKLEHKDKLAERDKQYRLENKDKIAERIKQWRLENKDKLAEINKQKITCDCGCVLTKCSLPKHKRSKKHQDLLNKHLV